MQSAHTKFFKSNAGMAEAIQYVKESRKEVIPGAKTVVTVETRGNVSLVTPTELETSSSPQTEEKVTLSSHVQAANDARYNIATHEKNPDPVHTSQEPVTREKLHETSRELPEITSSTPPEVVEKTPELVQEITPGTRPGNLVEKPVQSVSENIIETAQITPSAVVQKPLEEISEDTPSPVTEKPSDVPENSLENQENEVEYIEGAKNITSAYTTFINRLLTYNEMTLDRDGSESSESILLMRDLLSIKNEIDVSGEIESKATAEEALSRIKRAREFLMSNIYPIRQGVAVFSRYGFDTLSDSLSELRLSLTSTYQNIEDKNRESDITTLIRQLDNDVEEIDTIQKKKRAVLERHL
jgi:hypothetical protein